MEERKPRLSDHLPGKSVPVERGPTSGRRFSWPALIGAAIVIGIGAYADLGKYSDVGFKIAMALAAVVAFALVAPHLFMEGGEKEPATHPDPDVRALLDGKIDLTEYSARKDSREKDDAV